MLKWNDYLAGLKNVMDKVDGAAIDAVVRAIQDVHANDKVIYTCGNGGSAATASHMVNDLVKAPADASGCRPIRTVGLADCIPLMTALANDIEYAQMFSKQLEAYGREGDLLIGISGSGNSANVLEAARVAKAKGMKVIGMTGYSGGKLAALSDIHINVPCNCMAQVEDVHMVIEHAFVEMLKEAFGGKSSAVVG